MTATAASPIKRDAGDAIAVSSQPETGAHSGHNRRTKRKADPVTLGLIYRIGRIWHARGYSSSDWQRALKLYTQAAQQGYLPAQHDLGMLYLKGPRVLRQNFTLAAGWLRKAAEQGFAPSQYALAPLYLSGTDVDATGAAKWFRMAAEQGLAAAQYEFARLLELGRGVPPDDEDAAIWYTRAAEQGHAAAQFSLGAAYEAGRGVTMNPEIAREWFESAALRGNQQALARLADPSEAQPRQWQDQLVLGMRYVLGEGVPKDPARGAQLIADIGKKGSAQAQFSLAMLYAGGYGLAQDQNRMMFWLEAAANQGFVPAQTSLG